MVRMRGSSTHAFWRFISFEFDQNFLRWRWIIPIPIALFIAYIVTGGILAKAANFSIESNVWDVIFSVFGNGNVLFFVLNVVLIYLVSDLPIKSRFGELIIFRLHSRKQWWFGQISMLVISALLYLTINVLIIAGIASFALPWQNIWSEGMLKFPQEFYVNPQAITLSPFPAFLMLIILLILGWLGIGLATICATRFLDQSMAGFLFGLLLNTSGLIGLKAGISPPLEHLFIHVHILFNLHSYNAAPSPYPSFIVSVLYWMIWIIFFLVIGFTICLPVDFLSKEQAP